MYIFNALTSLPFIILFQVLLQLKPIYFGGFPCL